MKTPRLDDLVERVDRRPVAEAAKVLVQVVLETVATGALRTARIDVLDDSGVDHVGAELSQLVYRSPEDRIDLRVECGCVVRLAPDAETCATQTIIAKGRRV